MLGFRVMRVTRVVRVFGWVLGGLWFLGYSAYGIYGCCCWVLGFRVLGLFGLEVRAPGALAIDSARVLGAYR